MPMQDFNGHLMEEVAKEIVVFSSKEHHVNKKYRAG